MTTMVNALTIDVEEYFHAHAYERVIDRRSWDALPSRVVANTRRVLDVLRAHDTRATFFVLGWVAERRPNLVKEIARRRHEIACHGYAHRLAYQLGAERFRADVRRAKEVLEDCVSTPVIGFRAASYSIVAATPWAHNILVEEGFQYDSSIFPVRHDLYGIPDFSRFPVTVRCVAGEILEIPPSTVRMFNRNWPMGGGGYLRIFPYWFTTWAIRRIHRQDRQPAMVYVHPWEFDVDQPRLPAGALARFRQYTNLRKTEPRLRRLLREFAFAPVADVVGTGRVEACAAERASAPEAAGGRCASGRA